MVCQTEDMNTCSLRRDSVWPTTIPKSPSSSRDQKLLTSENGSSQRIMLPSSTSTRHHVTSSRQQQGNLYSAFPCATTIQTSCSSSNSSDSSRRNSAVSRNGERARIATPPPFSPQQQQQRLQQRISLPPPLPASASAKGCRGTVPSAGDAGTSFTLSLLRVPFSSRPQSLAEPSSSSQTQLASLRAQQSWRSAESLDRDSTSPMPSPGPGGCHSSPCSPTLQSSRSQTYLYLYKHLPKGSSETDYERLGRSMHGLCEGCFYYSDLDSDGARTMLQNAQEGTFLVRDSSDPKFLFSLTVKTARGATSVRIQYYKGFFQLDCEDQMKRKLPRFETMLDLLDFHIAMCQDKQGSQYRWLESSKKKDMVVRLTTPRRHSPPSLSHLARVTINRTLEDLHLPSRSTDLLPLPTSMKCYLRAYPYKV